MRLHVALNGRDIDEYDIVPLEGFLNALLKPAGLKKLVTNSNSAFDGVIPVINGNRKRDKRNVTLNFFLRASSLIDKRRCVENLEEKLIAGKDNSGINELYVHELGQCYRLIYEGVQTYNAVCEDKVIIAVKFTEYCPTPENRVP